VFQSISSEAEVFGALIHYLFTFLVLRFDNFAGISDLNMGGSSLCT
jgi:hypothetical protein